MPVRRHLGSRRDERPWRGRRARDPMHRMYRLLAWSCLVPLLTAGRYRPSAANTFAFTSPAAHSLFCMPLRTRNST